MLAAQPQLAQIHLGPGRLGLGLVVLSCIDSDIDVHLIAREGSKLDPDKLSVTLYYDDGSSKRIAPLEIGSLSAASCVDQLCAEARDALEKCPNLLVTTALTTKGLADCGDFIVELLARRPRDLRSTTVFIAAENDPGPSSVTLESKLRDLGVDCRKTVVNRLCYTPKGVDVATERDVRADELAEWVIEGRPDQDVLLALGGVDHVRFVDDIEPFEVRKRWLVNGGHLALAVWARDGDVVTLDEAASEPLRSEWLAEFHAPLVRVLERRWPVLAESASYARDHVKVWARHEDDVDRVLRRMNRADLLPFIGDVERKLVEPVDALRWGGEPYPELEAIFYRLQAVLCDLNKYRDWVEIQKGNVVLSEQADADVLLRYGRMLEKVFPHEEAQRLTRWLGRAFAQHRDG